MTQAELLKELNSIGFKVAREPSAYVGAVRLGHHAVGGVSVFVGDGPGVHYKQPAELIGSGAFLIANGRGHKRGMTQVLLSLGVEETGHIPDPDSRPQPDDPYWRGDLQLQNLLSAMRRRFRV